MVLNFNYLIWVSIVHGMHLDVDTYGMTHVYETLLQALIAIKNLLQLERTEAVNFRDFCKLDKVLESMREKLQHLMTVESEIDFLLDMESLRSEVELIFQRKIEKVALLHGFLFSNYHN